MSFFLGLAVQMNAHMSDLRSAGVRTAMHP